MWGSAIFFITCIAVGLAKSDLTTQIYMQLVFAYMIFLLLRSVLFFFGALKDKINHSVHHQNTNHLEGGPRVSIIIPAYNEEKVIEKSLNNLMGLNYHNYEMIVVDDGSSDGTFAAAQKVADASPMVPIQVIRKANGGKSSALNVGIRYSGSDFILCVDADSKLHPDTIKHGVHHFQDPTVASVAGFVEIANQHLMITKFQQLEYAVSLNFSRRAMSYFDCVPVVPGPVGMFRKSALLSIGAYSQNKEIFAEDAELSLHLLADGWKIKSEELMIAYTEAPETYTDLFKQRYRWNRGIYQAFVQNLPQLMYGSGSRGVKLGIYLFLDQILLPIIDIGFMLSFVTHFAVFGEATIFSVWMGLLFFNEFIIVLVSSQNDGRYARWIGVSILSRFSYSIMLATWKVLSLIEEWKNEKMTWNKLDRTGNLG